MLIIAEGSDKSGKSTLCDRLALRLGFRYVHHGAPTAGADGYIDELLGLDEPIIMDRSFIGEMVYGPILRGKSCLSKQQLVTLLRLCGRYRALVIHCEQPLEIWSLWSAQEEKLNSAQNAVSRVRFKGVMNLVAGYLPVLGYAEHTAKGMEEFIQEATPMILEMDQPHLRYHMVSGIGSMNPSMILVGDQVNHSVTWRNLPFDAGVSAEYLNQTLELAKIPQQEVHLMNAYNHQGRESNFEELKLLSRGLSDSCKIVALGKTADRWLKQQPELKTYWCVEHPQYRRRFKHHEIEAYAQQFKEVYDA